MSRLPALVDTIKTSEALRAAFKAHGKRLTSLVDRVRTKGGNASMHYALLTSGVPCTRLFAANFGMSERIMIEE